MSDMLNYLDNKNRIFEWWGTAAPTTSTPLVTGGWQSWSKSWVRGATFIDILIIGSGGAGGGGATHTTGVSSAGAGGGGGGAIAKARFLLDMLPDTLYIY